MTTNPNDPGGSGRRQMPGPVQPELRHAELLAHAAIEAKARNLDELLIVDADFHETETEFWSELLEYFDNDVVRHMLETGKGGEAWWYPAAVMTFGIQEVGGRIRPQSAWGAEPGPRGAEREARLTREAMDLIGIDYAVVFPTVLLDLGTNPFTELERHISRAYARWLTERLLPQEPRLRGLLHLPFTDADACLEIIEEFGDAPGVAGVMVTSVRSNAVHANAYMKVYAALEERGLALTFHSSFDFYEQATSTLNKFISVHSLGFPLYSMIQATNLVINGIPERFPRLKVVFVESGLAWVPFLMQRLDHEFMMRTSEAPLLTKRPSEYLKEFYYTSQPLEVLDLRALETTFEMINGETQVLWASDWPHWDFDLPSRIYDLPFLSKDGVRRVLGENAAGVFNIPAEKRAGKAAGTA